MPNGAGRAIAAGGAMVLGAMLSHIFEQTQKQAAADQQTLEQIRAGSFDTNTLQMIDDKAWSRMAGGDKKAGETLKMSAMHMRQVKEQAAQLMMRGLATGAVNPNDPKSLESFMGKAITEGQVSPTSAPEMFGQMEQMEKERQPAAIAHEAQTAETGRAKEKNVTELQKSKQEVAGRVQVAGIGAAARVESARISAEAREYVARMGAKKVEQKQGAFLQKLSYAKQGQTVKASIDKDMKTLTTDATKNSAVKATVPAKVEEVATNAIANLLPHDEGLISGTKDSTQALNDAVTVLSPKLPIIDPTTGDVTTLKAAADKYGTRDPKTKVITPPPFVQEFVHKITQGGLNTAAPMIDDNRKSYANIAASAPVFVQGEDAPSPEDIPSAGNE